MLPNEIDNKQTTSRHNQYRIANVQVRSAFHPSGEPKAYDQTSVPGDISDLQHT